MKNKSCQAVTQALELYFKQARLPWKFMTNKDRAFLCKDVQQTLNRYDIIHYTTENTDVKASQAERVIRTIKNKIYKFLTATGSKKYVDVLPSIVKAYNNTVHSTTGMKPADVTYANQRRVLAHVYGPEKHLKPKFHVGDTVRLSVNREMFRKGYTAQWTRELFRVVKVINGPIPVYATEDMKGERVMGTFYPQ
jgi:hypothetical protein